MHLAVKRHTASSKNKIKVVDGPESSERTHRQYVGVLLHLLKSESLLKSVRMHTALSRMTPRSGRFRHKLSHIPEL